MNHGDRREPIFKDEADRQRFVEAMLAQKQVTTPRTFGHFTFSASYASSSEQSGSK
jgi:hypothetical protein